MKATSTSSYSGLDRKCTEHVVEKELGISVKVTGCELAFCRFRHLNVIVLYPDSFVHQRFYTKLFECKCFIIFLLQ